MNPLALALHSNAKVCDNIFAELQQRNFDQSKLNHLKAQVTKANLFDPELEEEEKATKAKTEKVDDKISTKLQEQKSGLSQTKNKRTRDDFADQKTEEDSQKSPRTSFNSYASPNFAHKNSAFVAWKKSSAQYLSNFW